jgi:hypothetical protein
VPMLGLASAKGMSAEASERHPPGMVGGCAASAVPATKHPAQRSGLIEIKKFIAAMPLAASVPRSAQTSIGRGAPMFSKRRETDPAATCAAVCRCCGKTIPSAGRQSVYLQRDIQVEAGAA